MNLLPLQRRTIGLLAVSIPLLVLFIYVGFQSGPLAPVTVTVTKVESRSIAPALFGIGTVEARYTYKIGPTSAGRIKHLDVQVGDHIKAGQLLGEMEPIDLDARVRSQEAAIKRAEAGLSEAEARQAYAQKEASRYEQLLAARSTSEQSLSTKRQELQITDAGLLAAREELARARSDREALAAQRSNLRLIAPVDGVVSARVADPGTTIVAGQAVVEVIDPLTLWVNVRLDQVNASGLARGLPAHIALRSRTGQLLKGHVYRIEPLADAVTEEILAKIVFEALPEPLPPVGVLAEVTIDLPALPAAPVIPNAAIHREGEQIGVWRMDEHGLTFVPLKLGAADLNGWVQVREGLNIGDSVVVYHEKPLKALSRIHVVTSLPGSRK